MIAETALAALIGLPIWWTGWQILDWIRDKIVDRILDGYW